MLHLDLRLGKYLSEARLEEANQRRLHKTAAEAKQRRHLTQRLGRTLTALGERLENRQARAA